MRDAAADATTRDKRSGDVLVKVRQGAACGSGNSREKLVISRRMGHRGRMKIGSRN